MCQTTIIFGLMEDGNLLIHSLASFNCGNKFIRIVQLNQDFESFSVQIQLDEVLTQKYVDFLIRHQATQRSLPTSRNTENRVNKTPNMSSSQTKKFATSRNTQKRVNKTLAGSQNISEWVLHLTGFELRNFQNLYHLIVSLKETSFKMAPIICQLSLTW